MDVEEYMNRKCICGTPRSEHAHFRDRETGTLHVLAVTNGECYGFLDEIEMALGGKPTENPLLGPLIQAELQKRGLQA